jgi:hypothetical protein
MAVPLLSVLAAMSGHLGEPLAEVSAQFGIAAAGEVKPWRSHCVRATHVDHLAFVTSQTDTSTIYRDLSANKGGWVAFS